MNPEGVQKFPRNLNHIFPGQGQKIVFKPDQMGTIAIIMSAMGDSISVRFQDDGIGIPEEMDLSKAKSLGMKLISSLVIKQLKGSLRICRNPGTEIIFSFRIS